MVNLLNFILYIFYHSKIALRKAIGSSVTRDLKMWMIKKDKYKCELNIKKDLSTYVTYAYINIWLITKMVRREK